MSGMKLRKGDRVKVLSGKDRGKEGEVVRAMPAKRAVIVDGVNTAKRHQKSKGPTMQAGIIDKDMPVPVGVVAILCPNCGPTRIGYRIDESGKHRVCRKCGGDL